MASTYSPQNKKVGMSSETTSLLRPTVEHMQVARCRKNLRGAHWQLFVITLFDASVCALLWCLVVETLSSKHKNIYNDVVHYNFSHSLLDVAASGILRFVILTTAYSAIKIESTWVVVALSVIMSIFFIVKTYFFASKDVDMWDYLIVGVAFLLCWVEVAFYVTRVSSRLKQLDLAKVAVSEQETQAPIQTAPREDHPLAIAIATRKSSRATPGTVTPALSEYMSAASDVESDQFGTPESGDDLPPMISSGDSIVYQSQRAIHLSALGEDAVHETWELATGDDVEWQLEIDTPEVSVWSCDYHDRRVLKSEGFVPVSPSILFHMLHKEVESQARWNPIINQYEIIEEVDRYTDVTYTVTSTHAGGMISPRDFVSVRQWLKRDGNMVISEQSISHDDRPPSDDHIRGLYGPGGYVLLSVPDQPHVTNVIWIFNADLKGWLPRYLVDQTLANLLMKHHECMRDELQAYNTDAVSGELYV